MSTATETIFVHTETDALSEHSPFDQSDCMITYHPCFHTGYCDSASCGGGGYPLFYTHDLGGCSLITGLSPCFHMGYYGCSHNNRVDTCFDSKWLSNASYM